MTGTLSVMGMTTATADAAKTKSEYLPFQAVRNIPEEK